MKYNDAVMLITKVCAGYSGNLAEHKLIQEALTIVFSKNVKTPVQVEVPAKVSKKSKKK